MIIAKYLAPVYNNPIDNNHAQILPKPAKKTSISTIKDGHLSTLIGNPNTMGIEIV